MHSDSLARRQHDHHFHSGNAIAERGTRVVMVITALMMVLEIVAGWWFNSMALLADGWHMSSHAVAIGVSTLAYASARRYANDVRFSFGTWKIEVLAGFASAIFLLGVAALMIVGSIERILSPQPIHYQEAVLVAILGIVVNVVCALILGHAHDHGHRQAHAHDHGHERGQGHGHGHGHGHDDSHAHGHSSVHADSQDRVESTIEHATHDHPNRRPHGRDLNLRSAYIHIIADAATSVFALAALIGGWVYGWSWLDPLMGIIGATLVAVWAKGLIIETGTVLLDREMDHPVVDEIREVVEANTEPGATRLSDLHVWRVGRAAYSCAMSVVTHDASLTPDRLRERLAIHEEIVHSTIEIHFCPDAH